MLEMIEEMNPRRASEPKRKVLVRAIRYRNPTNLTVRMHLIRDEPTYAAYAFVGYQSDVHGPRPHHPQRVLEVVVPPGGECQIPWDCAFGVHIEQCTICTVAPLYCRKPEHRHPHVVVGGAGPGLVRIDDDGKEEPTQVHASLVEPAAPRFDVQGLTDLHERTLRRLAAKAGAK